MLWLKTTVVRAKAAYTALIEQIHADGYPVENYQFPLIADERRAGPTLLQRLIGLVDVRTDREVWMQYNSFVRTLGPGILWSYGPEAQALAVNTTGSGPDVPGHPQFSPLNWEELARDLRLAWQWADELYIPSLEGWVAGVPGAATLLRVEAGNASMHHPKVVSKYHLWHIFVLRFSSASSRALNDRRLSKQNALP